MQFQLSGEASREEVVLDVEKIKQLNIKVVSRPKYGAAHIRRVYGLKVQRVIEVVDVFGRVNSIPLYVRRRGGPEMLIATKIIDGKAYLGKYHKEVLATREGGGTEGDPPLIKQ